MIGFSDEQKKLLSDKLESKHVKPPSQYGPKGDYLEGWHVIAEANRIFGFDGWSYEVMEAKCVAEMPRKIGRDKKDGFGVTYTAKVRVLVAGVMREDFGAGHGYDVDAGLAHESAIKEAVTDALKRALRTFGNPFGLALYDKTRENVEVSHPEPRNTKAQEPAKQESKANSRELYAKLVEDMRLCKATADLARWWKDAECISLRHKLPTDWQKNLHEEFVALGFELKKQEEPKARDVVADIEDTFPGSTVVNERIMHPLMAGE